MITYIHYVPEMLCNKPMPVLGATVSHPSLSVHASATYRCSPGYRTAGGDFSHVCQGDGTWSGQRPICEGQSSYHDICLSILVRVVRCRNNTLPADERRDIRVLERHICKCFYFCF